MHRKAVRVLAATALLALVACSSDTDATPGTTNQTQNTNLPDTTNAVTTSATETTDVGPRPLPPVTVVPGTYRIDAFAVPFDVTVAGQWVRYASTPQLVLLGRGTNATTEFVVTSGLVAGSTPEAALDGFCTSGDAAFGASVATTLLGSPALQLEGTVGAECNWAAVDTVSQLVVPVGSTVRVVAADVDGTMVVVVADAPADEWSDTIADFELMIASMTRAD